MSKDLHIETLRGIAVILMVAGHVIGDSRSSGMHVPDNSAYRYFYDSFIYIRLPLFTFLSGYVYAYRPVTRQALNKFMSKKVRRLLVPLAVLGSILFMLQILVTGSGQYRTLAEIWKIFVLPYAHFWFLQALFIIFLVVAILEVAGWLASFRRWLAVMCVAALAFLQLEPPVDVFSIGGAIYLLPFFLFGVGAFRFSASLTSVTARTLLCAILPVAIVAHHLALNDVIQLNLERTAPLALIIGLSATLGLLMLRPRHPMLAEVGRSSYAIYLMHVFGTAAVLMMIGQVTQSKSILVFTCALAAGVLGPMIAERLLERHRYGRVLFLGRA